MTILKKIAQTVVITPAIAADAGSPPTPARTVTTTEWVPVESTTYITGIPLDGGGYTPAPLSTPGSTVIGSYTTRTYELRTVTTSYPADPGRPPRPYQPAVTAVQYALGWDGGARSIEGMTGDGVLAFSVPFDAVGAVVGLTPDSTPNYSNAAAAHGLFFRSGLVSVIEGGVEKTGTWSFASSDVFKIARTGNTVRYYQGTTLRYTSEAPSYGEQWAVASLYSGADAVYAAHLSGLASDIPADGMGGAVLRPIAAQGSDHETAGGGAVLRPFTAQGTGERPQGGGAVLPAFIGMGSDHAYAGGVVKLPAITASGKSVAGAPTYSLGTVNLPLFTSSAIGVTPSGVLEPATSLGDASVVWPVNQWEGLTVYIVSGTGSAQSLVIAANTEQALLFNDSWTTIPDASSVYEIRDGATVLATGRVTPQDGAMRPYTALGANYAYAGGRARLPTYEGVGYQFAEVNNWALLTAPMFQLQAIAHQKVPTTIDATMPMPTLQAFTGAFASLAAPRFALEASATVAIVGKAQLVAPHFQLEASATIGSVGRAELTMPSTFTLQAFSGAVARITLQDGFTLEASGSVGARGRAELTMPLFELEASATLGIVARAELTMPMLRAVASGLAELTAPSFQLQAVGTVTIAVEHEAYVMALPGNEVTRYTGLPFHQVVRFQGRYYGVGEGGLFELGGDTDDGAPIAFTARTAATDFGTSHLKQVNSAYFGGRLGEHTAITILAGEEPGSIVSYDMPNLRGAVAQNHRQKFGKGLKARYYALELSDPNGGPLELESIEFEVNTLQRKV